ncbi:response regulator [Candidatus Binatia bacterium]|nr:response regulator [Candidatus Binatia bacterium]
MASDDGRRVRATRKRILIVDDEEDIRALLARLVRREGYEPVVACDGEEALRATAATRPDIMLLDVKMPGLDGIEVLHEVRRAWPDLPVIMITSQAGAADVRGALLAGARDFIKKPFDHAEVLGALRSIVAAGSEGAGAIDGWRNRASAGPA